MPNGERPPRGGANEKRKFGSKTVGRQMDTAVPTANPDDTIADVERTLLARAKGFVTLNYVYVVDAGGRLVGVMSIKELFRSPKSSKVGGLMRRDLVTVRPNSHQERAALLALRHSLKAVPVVDKDSKFLGVVAADAIQSILHNEAVEDALLSAGITAPKDDAAVALLLASPATHVRRRLPWLIVGLVGGVVAAGVVDRFHRSLEAQLVLASFIPMVVYIADAVGSQTQTIFIRSLVLDPRLSVGAYVGREMRVSVMLAAALGASIAAFAGLWWGSPLLATVLGLSITATILISTLVALVLPWTFLRLRLDPAIASGPFATLIRDISNLFIYFTIASVAIGNFG
jgi:magnesium transporter